MELKKIRSAGDPDVVRQNKNRIDPLGPSIIAVSFQAAATVYLYLSSESIKAVISSGVLTLVYVLVSYLLIKKPKKTNRV